MIFFLTAACILLFICFYEESGGYMDAWLKGSAAWCILMFLCTEILSLFHCLNGVSVSLFWAAVCVCATAWVIRKGKYGLALAAARDALKAAWHNKFLTVLFMGIMVLSYATVPYNWDSMTYHLPRIAHWAQNQSVAHYGSTIYRQLSNPPLHEFVGLHVYLLSGKKDVFLNLIQCAAFLTNAWLVYEMAYKLGCKRKYCKMGILLLASMPIAVGEALTTQNDHFAGMWLLIFAYYLLDFLHKEEKIDYSRKTIVNCCIMAVSVGFGYMTKPSVCIGMLLMAIVLLVYCIVRKDSVWTIVRLIAIVLPLLLALIVPEAVRNIVTFRSVLSPATGASQLVGTWKPTYLFINGLKNVAFNFPSMFVPQSRQWIESIVRRTAALLRVNIDDSAISEGGRAYFVGAPDDYGHDTAVSSIIVIIALVCFLWCLYRWKKQERFQRQYTCIAVAVFTFFCILVRWEPFVSRYMLPYMILLCPMATVQIQDISEHAGSEMWRVSAVPVVCTLCVIQLCSLFNYHVHIAKYQNQARPEGYFYNRSNIRDAYIEACSLVVNEGYREVGLIMNGDSYEYPIWHMLQGSAERIDNVWISEETSRYEDMSYEPECVLAIDIFDSQIEIHGNDYKKVTDLEVLNVYLRWDLWAQEDNNG